MYRSLRTQRNIDRSTPPKKESVANEVRLTERTATLRTPDIDLSYCEFLNPVTKVYYDENSKEHTLYLKRRCRRDKCGAWDNEKLRCRGRQNNKSEDLIL